MVVLARVARPRTILAVVVILAGVSLSAAQTVRPRPNPAPGARTPAAAGLPGRLLISVDDDAMVSIDDQPAVQIRAGEIRAVSVSLGAHVVRATAMRASAVTVQQVAEFAEPGQRLVEFTLRAAATLTNNLAARRNASTGERGTPVVVVVDAPLAEAAAAVAPSLVPLRVWLESATGGAIGPRAPHLASAMHVELTQRTEGPAAAAGTKDMQSCPVSLVLDVFRGGTPASYTFNASGAAFSPAQACATARQRAITAAIGALTTMVRKELR